MVFGGKMILNMMLVTTGFVVLAMIALGIFLSVSKIQLSEKIAKLVLKGSFAASILIGVFLISGVLIASNSGYAQETHSPATTTAETTDTATIQVKAAKENGSIGLGYLAAALAVGIGSLGAGIATGMSASAAIGAISENPNIMGKTLVFVGMAEGIAIYGLIIAIMVLNRL